MNGSSRSATSPSRSPPSPDVFINPVVTRHQAAPISAMGGPVHTDQLDQLHASAGWLLQHAGYGPGRKITDGVYCSGKRALTVVARELASSAAYTRALDRLSADVHHMTGIRLTVEPYIMPCVTSIANAAIKRLRPLEPVMSASYHTAKTLGTESCCTASLLTSARR